MSIKQVRVIKIIRLLLISTYLYLMYNQSELNPNFRISYFILSTIVFICGASLINVIPKEYQFGSAFLKPKLKWIEFILEIAIMLGLALVLTLF